MSYLKLSATVSTVIFGQPYLVSIWIIILFNVQVVPVNFIELFVRPAFFGCEVVLSLLCPHCISYSFIQVSCDVLVVHQHCCIFWGRSCFVSLLMSSLMALNTTLLARLMEMTLICCFIDS